jgi:transposase
MAQLSAKAKEAIVLQALNRKSKSLYSIAQSNNVGLSTLQKWIRKYREGQPLSSVNERQDKAEELKKSERFEHILATHNLDESSLGEYCRTHGIYSHQLTTWREEFMSNNPANKDPKYQIEIKSLKEDKKRLERELRRKDKALAEASALLILKKKADLIWGESEDD